MSNLIITEKKLLYPNIVYEKVLPHNAELDIFKLMHKALALIVIAWMNYGFFTYAMPYVPNYIRYGFYFAWLGLALISNKRFLNTFVVQFWPLFLFYFYIIFLFLFVNSDLVFYAKSMAYLIMVYSIFLYYFNDKHKKFQKFLCAFLILDCIAVGINTYFKLQINPMLVRYLSTGIETRERLLGSDAFYGVANYGYFYALVSIILLLGFLFLNYRKRKLLIFLLIFAFTALLIQASYTIAVLFTAIFLTLLFILKYSNKYTFVAIALIGVITILIFQNMFALIFYQLADIKGISYEVSMRFKEIAYFFSGINMSGTDLNARLNLYSQSMDAFANNILIGVIDSNAYSAGGHSAWLDLLSQFGLFSILFFLFLFNAYKYCKNRVPKNFRPFVNVYWLYFISLGFINTLLFANIFTIWFLFLPLVIKSLQPHTNT
ncbi:MAG: hypothetical protein Q7J15_08450 [Candidatus Desulfaltia sp.]|nr:hypothetical protein [Candidatus Desulfaltia sp.]